MQVHISVNEKNDASLSSIVRLHTTVITSIGWNICMVISEILSSDSSLHQFTIVNPS